MYNIRAPGDNENTRALIYLIVAIVLGLIGGTVCLFFFKLGLFIVGVLGGFALASFIMTWSPNGIFNDNWANILFISVISVVVGVLILFFERPIMIVSTSTFGSYATFVGIDCFARTGFMETASLVLQNENNISSHSAKVYGMLAGTIILAIIGIFYQFKYTKS
ncbi:hypothetical protein AYI69_g2351 [Smittium culicis]|uniref:Transmembrane protein 198 n=1 Tax=Smittium culicis TaxID=133412 RepID=A0A1R1YMQ8_9FUNG|nr:hypothetical protein AYI69_g2351 [Smittium culicis]